jgi:hypothetical protein
VLQSASPQGVESMAKNQLKKKGPDFLSEIQPMQ